MRLSRYHAPTLREAPRDAEVRSHELLVRAGFIRQLSAGIYSLLPLGVRTVTKIANIVRQEMNRAGAVEVLMPAVQPGELWSESGRWEKYGPELLRFKDRKGNDFCLGPTHEEVIVDLVRRDVRSYKQLPLNLYQIQAKFRDEIRPRAGLMRGREFMMKDAYSFDVDDAAAHESYKAMFSAYERIFERCGLAFRAVEADTGNIGGSLSHEFQVLAETGEDAIVSCSGCTYTANVEMAELPAQEVGPTPDGGPEPTIVDTPGQHTVEEVCQFMGASPSSLIKTLILDVDGEPVAALVRGDRELNPLKVKRLYGADSVELAHDGIVREVTGAPVGFAGPVGLTIPVVADPEVMALVEAICGANAGDQHLSGVIPGVHFTPERVADLRMAQEGDGCPRCGEALRAYRGIEVGHVFFLGTKYSEAMDCTFLNSDGKSKPMVMGCYGIGVTRIMAAAIEQNHDEQGIAWPMALAPFEVAVIPLGKPGDEASEVAAGIYQELVEAGVEAILDDRKERPGVKFNDAELIGYPLQIVVGSRGLAEGVVEFKDRRAGTKESIETATVVTLASQKVTEARA
jgi:prolyl-tRNA synthetase